MRYCNLANQYRGAACVLAALAPALSSCAIENEMTPRLYASIVSAHADPLRSRIAKSLLATPNEPVADAGPLKLPPPPGLRPMEFDFGWVTESGAIVVYSKKFSLHLIQEPTIREGKVRWTCVVDPVEATPLWCRDS